MSTEPSDDSEAMLSDTSANEHDWQGEINDLLDDQKEATRVERRKAQKYFNNKRYFDRWVFYCVLSKL